MAKSISSSSSFPNKWTYDVFLNFRGMDTRKGFTGHLYKALYDNGIMTFIDDENLEKGEEIVPSLVDAIKNSRIAIVIFSKNYASSTYCLDELLVILGQKECKILPIFYEIDPSVVRHQIGSYREALAKHETRNYHKDMVNKWRSALHIASNRVGWHLSEQGDKIEYKVIQEIVEKVHDVINQRNSSVLQYGNVQQVCGTACTVCATAKLKLGHAGQYGQMSDNNVEKMMNEFKSVGFGAEASPSPSQGMYMNMPPDYHGLGFGAPHPIMPPPISFDRPKIMPPPTHGVGNGYNGYVFQTEDVVRDDYGRVIFSVNNKFSYK